MRIFDKHPLPWGATELPDGAAVIQDATFDFIAQFGELAVAEWAIEAMVLVQGTDVDLEEHPDG